MPTLVSRAPCRSRRTESSLPEEWEPFVRINYAFADGMDVVDRLVEEYATEHDVQNEPVA